MLVINAINTPVHEGNCGSAYTWYGGSETPILLSLWPIPTTHPNSVVCVRCMFNQYLSSVIVTLSYIPATFWVISLPYCSLCILM